MTTIDVHPSALGQLAYHVACSAHLAAGERSDECVPHAVLSWALLEAIGGEQLDAAMLRSLLDLAPELPTTEGTVR